MPGEGGDSLKPPEGSAPTGAASRKRKRPFTLRILLDTNQLFTGSASDLLQATLRKII